MGTSASKAAAAAPTAARRFPIRDPSGRGPASLQETSQRKQSPKGRSRKDEEIIADGNDPDFAPGDFSRRLHDMGVVQPNPTFSPSSTAQTFPQQVANDASSPRYPSVKHNATLSVLEARQYLQQQANDDFASLSRPGKHTKRFIDMRTLIDAMRLRDRGIAHTTIEERLNLQPGAVKKLGRHGVLSHKTRN